MRKLKTTSEPLETTDSALEMQQQPIPAASAASAASGNGGGGNTIILNPALHSAAANLTSSRLVRSRTAAVKRHVAHVQLSEEK